MSVGLDARTSLGLAAGQSVNYAADVVPQKDASVQDRIGGTLDSLIQAHGLLDALEGNAAPAQGGQPPLGLIGGALACEEQAGRLRQRLMQLGARLGNL